jgi:hypothetical protein
MNINIVCHEISDINVRYYQNIACHEISDIFKCQMLTRIYHEISDTDITRIHYVTKSPIQMSDAYQPQNSKND